MTGWYRPHISVYTDTTVLLLLLFCCSNSIPCQSSSHPFNRLHITILPYNNRKRTYQANQPSHPYIQHKHTRVVGRYDVIGVIHLSLLGTPKNIRHLPQPHTTHPGTENPFNRFCGYVHGCGVCEIILKYTNASWMERGWVYLVVDLIFQWFSGAQWCA